MLSVDLHKRKWGTVIWMNYVVICPRYIDGWFTVQPSWSKLHRIKLTIFEIYAITTGNPGHHKMSVKKKNGEKMWKGRKQRWPWLLATSLLTWPNLSSGLLTNKFPTLFLQSDSVAVSGWNSNFHLMIYTCDCHDLHLLWYGTKRGHFAFSTTHQSVKWQLLFKNDSSPFSGTCIVFSGI